MAGKAVMSTQIQRSTEAESKKPLRERKDDFSKLWSYVDQNEIKFVDQLIRLVSQPSISAQNIGLKECSELVREMMQKLGIKTQLISVPNAPDIVYGELRSEEKKARTLVIYNHYDVQPVEPLDEWKTDPFKPQVRDGKLFGRGTGDDKGELAARFCAIESLLNNGSFIRPHIKWVIEGEEETGSTHFHDFVLKNRSLLKGDGCLWEGGDRSTNGTPEIHLGTKGLVYLEFKVKVGEKDQHSMYGPIAPNPAWRLVNLLRTIRDPKGKILIEGFYDKVARPTAQEKKFLKNNEYNLKELREALKLDYLVEGKNDLETITNLLYSPTANIAGFASGYIGEGSKTIVPREAFVKMDFRLVANMKAKEILSKIKRHLKKNGFSDVQLISHSLEDPAKTPVESEIAQTMIHCTKLVTGKRPNVWPTSPGTGPLSLFTDKLKLKTAMGLGVSYPGSGFHAPNEHIKIEDYKEAIKQLICLFRLF
jgi:acetylornithine deacetylase/succinyl-diaminopimelate desuccinylase-like protein